MISIEVPYDFSHMDRSTEPDGSCFCILICPDSKKGIKRANTHNTGYKQYNRHYHHDDTCSRCKYIALEAQEQKNNSNGKPDDAVENSFILFHKKFFIKFLQGGVNFYDPDQQRT